MEEDGYFHIRATDLPWHFDVASLAIGVAQLEKNGWSPNFITVFDEAWLIPHQLSKLIKAVTGNDMIMDWYTWHIDPRKRARGWAPHRDRPESHPANSFREDKTPMYNTVWIPFTDATPDNSCLYVIPAGADPNYGGSQSKVIPTDENPLKVIFTEPERYQEIRAVPASAGSLICFSHRLIHWGSKANPRAYNDRFAFSFACSDDHFELPYFSRSHLPFPSLPLRTALVASQAINYSHQESLSKANEALFYRIFMTQQNHFNKDYSEKITSTSQWLKFTRKQSSKV